MPTTATARVLSTALSALLVTTALAASPASAAGADYTITNTVEVGHVSTSLALDSEAGRAYVPAESSTGAASAIAWLDTASQRPGDAEFPLGAAEPQELLVDEARGLLYVLHYRNGTLTVLDTADGSTQRTITGLPAYPSGLVQDDDSGLLYVLDDGLIPVDPRTGDVGEEIAISTQTYPLLRDAVYDPANHMIWVSEGRSNVITGYSTISRTWIETLAIPIGGHVVDGSAIGGRPHSLAIDPELGLLHAVVQPTFSEDWTQNLIVTIDTASGLHRGTPITVGDTVREIDVNPATHEVYAVNGFDNSLSVIRPDTWTVSHTLDFNEAGITQGTGAGGADTWALAVSGDGDHLHVTHPYGTARITTIQRSGSTPAATIPEVAPGQDGGEAPVEENQPWDGPEPAEPIEQPEGAVAISDPALRWTLNAYMKAWSSRALGTVVREDHEFQFTTGSGWHDPETGAASIAFSDGLLIQHYPGLAPEVMTTIGNPLLSLDADGSGTLSADVSWSVAPDTQSEGWRRVTIAEFDDAELTRDGDHLSLTAQPIYQGREYTDAEGTVSPASYPHDFIAWLDPAMQRWWYSTGASMDPEKAPDPFTVAFDAPLPETAPTPTPGDEDATTPPAPGEPSEPGGPDVPEEAADTAEPDATPADRVPSADEDPRTARAADESGLPLTGPAELGGLVLAAGLLLAAGGLILRLVRRRA